jgi:hypothetical protein
LLSRVKALGALAVLTILLLPPSLLVGPSASAHTASPIICKQTFIHSPNVGTGDNTLDGVATITSSDVWAVGEFAGASAGQTLTEHWDGVSWSVVSSPNVGAGSNFLDAVSADASNDVWAVGAFGPAGPGASQTLVEHWNGVSWSVVSSPSPGTSSNELRGVTTVSSSDVWAVGILSNTGGSSLTLVEHWDGVSWSVVPAVNFGSALTEFFAVTAVAPNNVWAVGDYQNTGPNQFVLPLTEHWNGGSWSAVPAAIPAGFGGNLHGVAATNPLRVWTVGEQSNNSTVDQTLTEHWTLSGWQVLTNPPIGTNFSVLRAVSAPRVQTPLAFAWAVGGFLNNGASSQTLTELIRCTGGR